MRLARTLFAKLRIGEKIALGFGFVGLLLLAVIGGYQRVLSEVLDDFTHLAAIHQNRSDQANGIAMSLLLARDAEKTFLLLRDESALVDTREQLQRLLDHTERLRAIDTEGESYAAQIAELTAAYRDSLEAIAEAWRIKGLDHNSGLQGAFRVQAHRLQEAAAAYATEGLYIDLLQIRRNEKDLGLRHRSEYRDRVTDMVAELQAKIQASGLTRAVKTALLEEIITYQREFEPFATRAIAGGDIASGTGAFRDAAHRIEALINSNLVPGMETTVLELRRREKDYLLRLDPRYVVSVTDLLGRLRSQVEESSITATEKSDLLALIGGYEQDFTALVEQNARIDELTAALNRSAGEVHALVTTTSAAASSAAAAAENQIRATAAKSSQIMITISAAATLIGILFTMLLTRWITGPVLRMAGFLDRLAVEDPVERIATIPGSRDEIQAMAESLNQMADHKKQLLAWWKNSLAEMSARTGLGDATAPRFETDPPTR